MTKQNVIKTVLFFLKIVHWISIIFLFLWILIPILGLFIPLEFANNDSEEIYIMIRFYGFPIAATLLILTGMMKRKHTVTLIVTKAIIAICIAIFSFFIAAIFLLGGVCGWITDNKMFFENKQNPSIKIVMRSFDCGAFDSSYPDFKAYKVRKITKDFIWATKIDTNQINKNEWIRVESKEQNE